MTTPAKNIGASVRARLLKLSKERKEDHQLLLVRYANERLLHRMAVSPYSSQFVLKGAALFTLWTGRAHRATRDLDLLGFGDSTESHVRQVFTEMLRLPNTDDAVVFDLASLDVGPIREDQEYGGVRVAVGANIGNAKLRLQIDIGFGDAITPPAEVVEFPTLLDFPAPRLRVYPKETVVAEKLDALVQLGMANSRMKDFFDMVLLSRMFEFDTTLVDAIRATFERRATPLPKGPPVALTDEFASDATKNTQWSAFLRKSGSSEQMGDLPGIIVELSRFAAEPLAAAGATGSFDARWPKGGPWARQRSRP